MQRRDDESSRPDPETLLAHAAAESPAEGRGRLKIFLGMSAGVGKTYTMLTVAGERRAQGLPVLVGWAETHGRTETAALLEGLDRLPPRLVEHRGTTLQEFDLEAALALRPPLILVDELAHTNAPGSRHAKRWQDVLELLQAGCDVWTTLNVQHVESLSDVVSQVTGAPVRERVPDSVIDRADEIELIDLPPDELLERLREGKVYVEEAAREALDRFFRKGNLIALRELALRATAERVDAQMQAFREVEGRDRTWPVAERILIAISASPSASRLVRAGRRMARRLRADWIVAWVDTPRQGTLPARDREYAAEALRLAETLGAETTTLDGVDAAAEIVAYARRRNVTRILVGKPGRFWWRDRLLGSFVDRIVRTSGEIDVTVVRGLEAPGAPPPAPPTPRRRLAVGLVGAAVVTALATLVAQAMAPHFELSNLAMVYLLGVVAVAGRWGSLPAALASLLSVVAFDYFFVPPRLTLAVSDGQYVVTFGVMTAVGLITAALTARIREQARAARRREDETVALYGLSRELAQSRTTEELAAAAARKVGGLLQLPTAVFLPDELGRVRAAAGADEAFARDESERAVAHWSFRSGLRAGWGTDTLPGAAASYFPLAAARGAVGVLGIAAPADRAKLPPQQVHLVEAFASQLALALERERLAEQAEEARLRAEADRLQNALLSSVSHDLRTPLAVITGSASTLLETGHALDAASRRELVETIYEESERLGRVVGDLLDMTRLASGRAQLRREWHAVDELVAAAVERLGRRLEGRKVSIAIPDGLPGVEVDGALVEQTLVNLLENAARHTPQGTPIDIAAKDGPEGVEVSIADRGPGVPADERPLVFEKFWRGRAARGTRGAGLGLAICRGVVEAHGGRIEVDERPGGGAVFRFTIPAAPGLR
ncbi:MAG: sensor histidine kinase KdpD [Candidatus Polarisedimenticolia bacterium]